MTTPSQLFPFSLSLASNWMKTPIHSRCNLVVGTHSFTFNHVCGSSGSPSSPMFEDCVSPLVYGLFQGYNATVVVLWNRFVCLCLIHIFR
ncbi:hypothetical protein L2E82_31854 [Cichorium intybus]|uniref:Uncharacterized protein n=2 Tax=Cichorium intybus TaxID=13427 RepID=A0ACB9BFW5_CICIN|nr:hypothetical protein L2E82_31852 [Cichorium intybus]KAI3720857.1 hypothetical protein L2E82_31854 [Cichorium intybus]